MKRLLCLLLLVQGIAAYTQSADTSAENKRLIDDSSMLRLQQLKDSALLTTNLTDTAEINENMSRNINSILELQRERKAKEKRAAIIRIAIGLGLLAVLIIGWRRRKK